MIAFVNETVLKLNITLYIYISYLVLQRRLEASADNKFYCVWITVFIFGKEITVHSLTFENAVDHLKDPTLKEPSAAKIECVGNLWL